MVERKSLRRANCLEGGGGGGGCLLMEESHIFIFNFILWLSYFR